MQNEKGGLTQSGESSLSVKQTSKKVFSVWVNLIFSETILVKFLVVTVILEIITPLIFPFSTKLDYNLLILINLSEMDTLNQIETF